MRVNATTALVLTLLSLPTSAQEETRDLRPSGAVLPAEKPEAPPGPEREVAPPEERPLPPPNHPKYVDAVWDRAAARHTRGRSCDAAADLDLLRTRGDTLEHKRAMAGRAYLACAINLARAGDQDAARARSEVARALLGDVPELGRALAPGWRLEAERALAAGDLEGARKSWDQARSAEPDLTDNHKFATRLLSAAEAAVEREQMEEARRYLAAAQAYEDLPKARALERAIRVREALPMLGAGLAGAVALLGVVLAVRGGRRRPA
ncbi:MAG: hypothetical protein AB2A00_33370 [Myxococcota bacterium]